MLIAQSVQKSYGHLDVLRDASLNVSKGELVAIMGKSGSGKSTLLHILGTLDQPDSGQISIDSVEPGKLGEKDLAAFRNESLGFIFQFHHLLPEFTALENVCIPGFIAKRDETKVRSRAKELLDFLGLSNRTDHRPGELSGGEAQRVAVARALINNPSMIFADEPTGNLDSQSSSEIHNLMMKLRHELGQTFLIVTHNAELGQLCDRILRIEDGVVKSD